MYITPKCPSQHQKRCLTAAECMNSPLVDSKRFEIQMLPWDDFGSREQACVGLMCVSVGNHNPLYTRNAASRTSSAHTKRRERCDWYWFLCKCSICKCTTRYNLHSHSVSAVYKCINPAPLSLEQLLTQSQHEKNNARKWDMTAHVCICTPVFFGDGSQTWKAIFN